MALSIEQQKAIALAKARQRQAAAQAQPSIEEQLTLAAGGTQADFNRQPEAAPELTLGERAEGIGETALALGTGATTGLFGLGGGFIEGVIKEVQSGEFGSKEAADRIEALVAKRMGEFTNTPESEAGKRFLKSTAETLEPLSSIPPLAEFQLLAGSSSQAAKGLGAARDIRRGKQLEKIQEIIDNPQSAKNVEFMVSGGKRVKDLAAKEAISLGVDAPTVSFMKGSSKVDRTKFAEMAKLKQKGLDDLRFAADNRAADIVGDSLAQRVEHLVKVNKSSGSRIDKVAKGLEGKTVDLSKARSDFIAKLESEGVTVVTNPESGKSAASYAGSSFQDLAPPQKAINSMLARLDDLGESADALKAHRAKRFIDESITLGGKGGEGLQGRSQGIVLGLRKGIDDTLDSNFRNYKRVNDTYAKTINALNEFQDSAGRKVDLTGPNASKAIGTTSRRLLNNTQARANMKTAIDTMERVADETGAKFSDDIVSQAMFANKLDDLFGVSDQRGLAAEVGKGVTGGQVLRATESPVSTAIEGGLNIAAKLKPKGDNVEKAFKAIDKLISR